MTNKGQLKIGFVLMFKMLQAGDWLRHFYIFAVQEN